MSQEIPTAVLQMSNTRIQARWPGCQAVGLVLQTLVERPRGHTPTDQSLRTGYSCRDQLLRSTALGRSSDKVSINFLPSMWDT